MSAIIDAQNRPSSRNDFTTAIVCALAEEATPVQALFDKSFDRYSSFYGRAAGDRNVYFNGLLAGHKVVLSYLPDMGTRGAAATLASLRISYTELQLVLVVGICGGVPSGPSPKSPERYLGDVIIADKLFVYDYGKQQPGEFKHTNPFRTHNDEAKALLKSLEGEDNLAFFREQFVATVDGLLDNRGAWRPPDAKTDVVYKPSHHHKHRGEHARGCSCFAPHAICNAATKASCEELKCAGSAIIRTRVDVEAANIFIGPMASADTVMKSGEDREALAKEGEVIGFEMEGSGAWDGAVPCIIVKGITDYADSHKNKEWRLYAAATGAAAAKTFLNHWSVQTKC